MCTISWRLDRGEYTVFFNRDESRMRARAIPPDIFHNEVQQYIMPLDPQGGGSWIAVNANGLTFALLNNYQGRLPKGRLRSRGLLVRNLTVCVSLEEVKHYLQQQNLKSYAPFSLLVFTPDVGDSLAPVPTIPLFRWDGRQLGMNLKTSPHFSSAIEFEEVCNLRHAVYDKLITSQKEVNNQDFLYLHRSHLPSKSAQSICMHREDACTVSFSQVSVNQSEILFSYVDGAPCEQDIQAPVVLRRRPRDQAWNRSNDSRYVSGHRSQYKRTMR